jgi:hypothetical protein
MSTTRQYQLTTALLTWVVQEIKNVCMSECSSRIIFNPRCDGSALLSCERGAQDHPAIILGGMHGHGSMLRTFTVTVHVDAKRP